MSLSEMPLDFSGSVIDELVSNCRTAFEDLQSLSMRDRIEAINRIKVALHEHSPFQEEPVDCVIWVSSERVEANDYNPNSVAPTEMKLLEHSIEKDGYTQPIVTWQRDETYEVVDGFHRNRVGRESKVVNTRIRGYLPVTVINESRLDRSDRIASTIRHNRARGKHRVEAMSDIVVELKRRNWTDKKIAMELGMDADEVLRLTQIMGLVEVFENEDFSQAWDIGIFDDEEIDGELLSEIEDGE